MDEKVAQSNGVEIAYETFGTREDPAILLVMGLGVQMIYWHEDFCAELAEQGFHVIRFDNRDIGHSTKFDGERPPDLTAILMGETSSAPYMLDDMADDAAGLLDHLGIEAAHVVGVSMGGMIAQAMAIAHPSRVRSLTSIMSTTGSRAVGQAREEVYALLLTPAPPSRDAYVEHSVAVWRTIGSTGFERDEDWVRQVAGRAFDRCFAPDGTMRQLAAILASPDRTEALRQVRCPALVIHGEDDPLIAVSGGRATAEAIPGAELIAVPGMGHDLPRALWPRIIDAIAANAQRVPAAAA
jgi:pimeloyl-ACP methyl ester carboxylesterase